jgi:hypothetical protein
MKKKRNKQIKSDYQVKNLKNPFFYRPKNTARAGKRWFFLGGLIILTGLTYFLLMTPFFNIKNINIKGLSRISVEEIKKVVEDRKNNRLYLFFSETNFFLFDQKKLEEEIIEKYNFSQLKIRKVLPDTLELEISERPYAFIFQQGTELFYASKEGYIIREETVKEEDKEKYFILENRSKSVSVNSRNKIDIDVKYLDFVFSLKDSLSYYQDLKPERFIIDQELNSLIVDFINGPKVYFNSKKDPKLQANDLALVKKEKIGDNFNIINYIDLRYGDMIFIN